jgi:hypothetical protein
MHDLMTTPALSAPPAPPAPPLKIRLGEELPVFCERCGYSLHGLPQARCENCQILQFHCPECGHRQPINTLRPAVQRILGRARAWVLGISVFIKLNMLFWLLFAWVGMGIEWSYERHYIQTGTGQKNYKSFVSVRPVDVEETFAFMLFALAFGMFARMLLLRWKRGYLVGAWLAALALGAVTLGTALRRLDFEIPIRWPWSSDFLTLLAITALTIITGASIVWAIWSGLVHVFLPRATACALLDWQSFRPAKSTRLARE